MYFGTKLVLLFLSLSAVKVDELNTVISLFHSERTLSVDQLSRLQNEIFATVLIDLKNNCDILTLAQDLEQLVKQYAPRIQTE